MALNTARRRRWTVFVLCSSLAVVLTQLGYFVSDRHYGWDLWLDRDQQGAWFLHQGEYLEAARRFEDPQWRAYAYYRAQRFAKAEEFYGLSYDAQAYFNRANALAHLGHYKPAIDFYLMAIALQPEYLAARDNMALVEVLDRKPSQELDYGSHSEGGLEADEVVYDLDEKGARAAEAQEVEQDSVLGNGERQRLWLDGLKTTLADFLSRKFHYQYQAQTQREVK